MGYVADALALSDVEGGMGYGRAGGRVGWALMYLVAVFNVELDFFAGERADSGCVGGSG